MTKKFKFHCDKQSTEEMTPVRLFLREDDGDVDLCAETPDGDFCCILGVHPDGHVVRYDIGHERAKSFGLTMDGVYVAVEDESDD